MIKIEWMDGTQASYVAKSWETNADFLWIIIADEYGIAAETRCIPLCNVKSLVISK